MYVCVSGNKAHVHTKKHRRKRNRRQYVVETPKTPLALVGKVWTPTPPELETKKGHVKRTHNKFRYVLIIPSITSDTLYHIAGGAPLALLTSAVCAALQQQQQTFEHATSQK